MISDMPATLTWTAPEPVLDATYRTYVDLVSDAFGQFLGALAGAAPDQHEPIAEAVERASDEAFMRVLMAPETTYRLLCRREALDERARFVADAFRAEAAREGDFRSGPLACETWTALGDVGFTADGVRIENPRLDASLAFDVLSPHAASVDLGGPSGVQPRKPFSPSAQARVVAKMNAAFEGIDRAGAVFGDFAKRFNFVFIAQIDRDDRELFTSGSTGQYIGRSFVTNPHCPSVRPADLAEALIHEGTHALLYMEERQRPWVTDDALYDPSITRVVSPWTGSPLAARPFLQACFVWYGLLHFWSAALNAGAFDPDVIHGRMVLAVRGFLAGPLERHLEGFREGVAPEVIDAIALMQARVAQSWPRA